MVGESHVLRFSEVYLLSSQEALPPPVYPGTSSTAYYYSVQTPSTPPRGNKRTLDTENEENTGANEPTHCTPLSPSTRRIGRPVKKQRKALTIMEKLDICLSAILDEAAWSLSDFLYHVFRYKDETGQEVHGTSECHTNCVRHFLQSDPRATYTPAMLVDTMLHHPYGRRLRHGLEHENQHMFSTMTSWEDIKSVRSGLTSWAAQNILRKLTSEAEDAVKAENGLHAMRSKRGQAPQPSDSGTRTSSSSNLTWQDIGANTVTHVEEVVRKHQGLMWAYFLAIAEHHTPRQSSPPESTDSARGGDEAVDQSRKYRPPQVVTQYLIGLDRVMMSLMYRFSQVALHALMSLNFSRTNQANLLPLATGILYFALSAPVNLIHYGSRIGTMPAYNTIYTYLEKLAAEEARAVLEHGSNPAMASTLLLDNVQNYHLLRDVRLGGEQSHLNCGLAATYVEGPAGCDITVFDLAEKHCLLAENKRRDLMVEQLFGFIDIKHCELVGALHFLCILVEHIPELKGYQAEVSTLFRTIAAKQQVPIDKSKLHSLTSSGKKETVTTELKAALLDFLCQIGQMLAQNPRLILIGGDGLTYEKIIQLKNLLATLLDDNAVESLDIIEPILALWHTGWTELGRIFTTHWGPHLSKDESTLGHSTCKMGRSTPPNLSKVDYKEGMEILLTVLNACVLDCYR